MSSTAKVVPAAARPWSLTRQGFVSTTDYEMDGSARPAFGGLLSDTFDEGKFGILVDADYTDKHQRRSEVRVSFRYGGSQ